MVKITNNSDYATVDFYAKSSTTKKPVYACLKPGQTDDLDVDRNSPDVVAKEQARLITVHDAAGKSGKAVEAMAANSQLGRGSQGVQALQK